MNVENVFISPCKGYHVLIFCYFSINIKIPNTFVIFHLFAVSVDFNRFVTCF